MVHKSRRLEAATASDSAPLIKQEFNSGWASEASPANSQQHHYYETQHNLNGTQNDDEDAPYNHEDAPYNHEDAQYDHEDAQYDHEDAQYDHEDAQYEHEVAPHDHEDAPCYHGIQHDLREPQHDDENARYDYKDAQHEDARREDVRHEDARHENARHEDARHEDARHEDARHEDARHENARHGYEDAQSGYDGIQQDSTNTPQYSRTQEHVPDTNGYHDEHCGDSIQRYSDAVPADGPGRPRRIIQPWSAEEESALAQLRKEYVLITDIAERSPRNGMRSLAKKLPRIGGTYDLGQPNDMIRFYRDHLFSLGYKHLRALFSLWNHAAGIERQNFTWNSLHTMVTMVRKAIKGEWSKLEQLREAGEPYKRIRPSINELFDAAVLERRIMHTKVCPNCRPPDDLMFKVISWSPRIPIRFPVVRTCIDASEPLLAEDESPEGRSKDSETSLDERGEIAQRQSLQKRPASDQPLAKRRRVIMEHQEPPTSSQDITSISTTLSILTTSSNAFTSDQASPSQAARTLESLIVEEVPWLLVVDRESSSVTAYGFLDAPTPRSLANAVCESLKGRFTVNRTKPLLANDQDSARLYLIVAAIHLAAQRELPLTVDQAIWRPIVNELSGWVENANGKTAEDDIKLPPSLAGRRHMSIHELVELSRWTRREIAMRAKAYEEARVIFEGFLRGFRVSGGQPTAENRLQKVLACCDRLLLAMKPSVEVPRGEAA